MGDRRELRSFAVVVILIGVVSATAFVSCGSGGGGGDSNGDLCQQCGDSDGPCNVAGATVPADDLTNGCPGGAAECHVDLSCTRKVDSGQRRCFPIDPTTGQLDFFFKCDGSRPIQSFAPTLTPTVTATPEPSASETPASTAPTATGPTPSATAPTPTATETPGGADDNEIPVTINFDTDEDSLPAFNAQVSYPSDKGNFTPRDCDDAGDGVTAQDSGSGILTLSFASNPDELTSASITCTFHQIEGQTLADGDLNASVAPTTVTVEIDEL
jgi:hypothetical protein